MKKKLSIDDLEDDLASKVYNATASLREVATDRHENSCGPKYGQPLHSCPDPICRDAVKALEEFD